MIVSQLLKRQLRILENNVAMLNPIIPKWHVYGSPHLIQCVYIMEVNEGLLNRANR